MKTRLLPANEHSILEAARVIREGGLVAFPTETVYGLGANALSAKAVAKIFAAKDRPASNPLIVHVASHEAAAELGEIDQRLTSAFWPGSLTIVARKRAALPENVTAGGPTVGLRCPAHDVALALIRSSGVPIAAPSANRSTRVSPVTAQHVLKTLDGRIEMVLDGGPTSAGLESTVLDITTEPPTILRPGPVSIAQIEAVIGRVAWRQEQTGPARSPGVIGRHYSPLAQVALVDGSGLEMVSDLVRLGSRVGWLTFSDAAPSGAEAIHMPMDPDAYASRLYDALHRLEDLGVEVIVIDRPPSAIEWAAVTDRLERSASNE